MTDHIITIEDLENLAAHLESSAEARREKLLRLIRAQARILAQRAPKEFVKMPIEERDEEGHYDSSFPPKVQYCNRTGPRLLVIFDCSTRDVPTTGGFYYNWKRVTEDRGFFVGKDGSLWGCTESGTGSLGQFAAHPGDCNVEVELEYSRLDDDELDVETLTMAEKEVRGMLKKSRIELGFAA